MANLQLFEPFSTEIFTDMVQGFLKPLRFEYATLAPSIKLEVSEKEDVIHVKAEVPGVRKEDIKVKIDGDRLSISAEHKQESDEKKNGKVVKSEFHYGVTSRAITLASEVDAAKSAASYENGVLQLTLPKLPSAGVRELAIS